MTPEIQPPAPERLPSWEDNIRNLPVSWHLMAWREMERWERYPAIEAILKRKRS